MRAASGGGEGRRVPGFVDPREFERGRRHASAYWLEQMEDDVAEAFMCMRQSTCRIGMDKSSRLLWTRLGGLMIGLRFSMETGEYETSFFRRGAPPRRG